MFDFLGKDKEPKGQESKLPANVGSTENNTGTIYADGTQHYPNFKETKAYLRKVKDARYRIELLENRIKLRGDVLKKSDDLEQQLSAENLYLAAAMSDVADEISKLRNVTQELVMTKRYINGMSWLDIADSMDVTERVVQKIHGRALPEMEKILLDDGLITIVFPSDEYHN